MVIPGPASSKEVSDIKFADELSGARHFKMPIYPIEAISREPRLAGQGGDWSGQKTGCGVTAHDVGCIRFVQEKQVNPAIAPGERRPKEHP
jgi:hypothetical protein